MIVGNSGQAYDADQNYGISNFCVNRLAAVVMFYANFSLENSYVPYPTDPTVSTPSTGSVNSNNNGVIIGASLGSILGVLILGIIGFFGLKKYKKARHSSHSTFIPDSEAFHKAMM